MPCRQVRNSTFKQTRSVPYLKVQDVYSVEKDTCRIRRVPSETLHPFAMQQTLLIRFAQLRRGLSETLQEKKTLFRSPAGSFPYQICFFFIIWRTICMENIVEP